MTRGAGPAKGRELVIPTPKLKLLDQVPRSLASEAMIYTHVLRQAAAGGRGHTLEKAAANFFTFSC